MKVKVVLEFDADIDEYGRSTGTGRATRADVRSALRRDFAQWLKVDTDIADWDGPFYIDTVHGVPFTEIPEETA